MEPSRPAERLWWEGSIAYIPLPFLTVPSFNFPRTLHRLTQRSPTLRSPRTKFLTLGKADINNTCIPLVYTQEGLLALEKWCCVHHKLSTARSLLPGSIWGCLELDSGHDARMCHPWLEGVPCNVSAYPPAAQRVQDLFHTLSKWMFILRCTDVPDSAPAWVC